MVFSTFEGQDMWKIKIKKKISKESGTVDRQINQLIQCSVLPGFLRQQAYNNFQKLTTLLSYFPLQTK